MTYRKRDKKPEKSSESVTFGLGKTLINCTLFKSSTQSIIQQNQKSLKLFCSSPAFLYELLK